MNLLGHFVCARHLSAETQAGSALGDLLPLYRRRVRPLALAGHWAAEAGRRADLTGVERGVRFHLLVDSHFHRAPLFTHLSGSLQNALRGASGTPGLKRFFPAHILSEMFLDHLLIEADGAVPSAFHDLFDSRIRALLAEFAAAHPGADSESFRAFLARILDDRFVDGYRTFAGIVSRMQRMLTRFGQRALEPGEVEAVLATFAIERERTDLELLQFVASMRHAVGGLRPDPGSDSALDGWSAGRVGPSHQGRISGGA